jgi:peptidoglycan/xylan/chitin deacetylase (PgdA/CDA1 family)
MGCEICAHSYSHEYYFTDSFMGKEENYKLFWQEINKATMLITEHLGVAPTYIRMPGGCHTDYMKNVPYVMVNWNLDTDDWDNKPPKDKNGNYINTEGSENKVYNVLMRAKDGDIVLMHSLYSWSYKATERAMKELSEKGYQFVNISELFYYKGMNPENGQTFSKAK